MTDPKTEMKEYTLKRLLSIPERWYDQMVKGELPSITMPTRTKRNIAYDEEAEVWKYGDRERLREAGTDMVIAVTVERNKRETRSTKAQAAMTTRNMARVGLSGKKAATSMR